MISNIVRKEVLVLLISLIFVSHHGYTQCSCAVSNTINITAGTTDIGTHVLGNTYGKTETSSELCIVASGGGIVTITGEVFMNGGTFNFCSSDGTAINFAATGASILNITTNFESGTGNVNFYTDVNITTDFDIKGFVVMNQNTSTLTVAGDVGIFTNTALSPNPASTLQNQENATLTVTGAIDTESSNATFLNYGTANASSSSSSGGGTATLENHGILNVTSLNRTFGITRNFGTANVTNKVTLSGGTTLDITGGIFKSNNLEVSSGSLLSDGGSCAVFIVEGVVAVNCGVTVPNDNVSIIDNSYGPDATACPSEANDPNKFKYSDFASASTCAQILPVHFLDVYLINNELHWITAQEENNEKFIVERSFDGKKFNSIGEVKGSINSNYQIKYTFIDNDTFSQQAYYRLKQVDIDGKFTYSKIVTFVDNNDPVITLYPNPVTGYQLNISIANVNENITYQLISSVGDIVFSEGIQVEDHFFEEIIDVSEYASGVYFVKVQTNQQTFIEQLVIE